MFWCLKDFRIHPLPHKVLFSLLYIMFVMKVKGNLYIQLLYFARLHVSEPVQRTNEQSTEARRRISYLIKLFRMARER